MRTYAVVFLSSLLIGAVLTPLVRRLARRIGAVDHALSSRKIHRIAIPRMGGVAIVLAFYGPLVALLFTHAEVGRLFASDPRQVICLFAGGAVVAALGIYDDLKGAGARTKFAVQFAVAAFAYAMGFRIDSIAIPFGTPIALGWLGLPVTMIWIVGVINAINLIDGLDGLAGGVALVAASVTFVSAVMHGTPLMALTSAALAGAILGFLRYNFNPASIFMGDTGSMFLGFVLSTSAIRSYQKSSTAVALLVPVVVLGLPIADTLLAMIRRGMRGAPLFLGDREHIHHRLLARGLTQRQAVLVLYGVSIACAAVALALVGSSGIRAALVLVGFALAAGLLLRRLGYMQLEVAGELFELRKHNLELLREVEKIGRGIRRASRPSELRASLKQALPALGASSVALRFDESRGPGGRRDLRAGMEARTHSAQLRTRHSLGVERPDAGSLEVDWSGGRQSIDRCTEIAVEQLCRYLHEAVQRLERNGALERVAAIETAVRDITISQQKDDATRRRRIAGGRN